MDEVVAICCCLAVNSTGIGSVKASSTLGNGPRGLLNKKRKKFVWEVFRLITYCFPIAPSGICAKHDCNWLIRFINSRFHDSK